MSSVGANNHQLRCHSCRSHAWSVSLLQGTSTAIQKRHINWYVTSFRVARDQFSFNKAKTSSSLLTTSRCNLKPHCKANFVNILKKLIKLTRRGQSFYVEILDENDIKIKLKVILTVWVNLTTLTIVYVNLVLPSHQTWLRCNVIDPISSFNPLPQ